MAADHDHNLITTLADYLWAVIMLVLGAGARWVYGHEQRVTRLEAQHDECVRARERNDAALHGVQLELRSAQGKLDRILGALDIRHEDG